MKLEGWTSRTHGGVQLVRTALKDFAGQNKQVTCISAVISAVCVWKIQMWVPKITGMLAQAYIVRSASLFSALPLCACLWQRACVLRV